MSDVEKEKELQRELEALQAGDVNYTDLVLQALGRLGLEYELREDKSEVMVWRVEIDVDDRNKAGITVLLESEDRNLLKLRAGFDPPKEMTAARRMLLANKWNKERRFTKVFVHDDGDFVLEADLNLKWLDGKRSVNSVIDFVAMFSFSTRSFIAEAVLNELKRQL